jgi:DNA-directed RNA polymerase specialized sigma24 family protein
MTAQTIALTPSWRTRPSSPAATWVRPDAGEFAALYETHVARIYRHVSARVGDGVLAGLTAQTFLKAWQSIDPTALSPDARSSPGSSRSPTTS